MSSVVGALFDEYSTLSPPEKALAIAEIGPDLGFDHFLFGSDTLNGSAENDVFLVGGSGTVIRDPGGIDLVISKESFTLPGGIEHLILTGSKDVNGTGNGGDNVIAGNDGNNLIEGRGGHDLLIGGAGNDTLIGGSSSDTMVGGLGNDCIYGGSGDDVIIDMVGNNTVDAGSGNDSIMTGMGDDCIMGGGGIDTIGAGGGNNFVSGGSGNDIFLFEGGEGTTHITDFKPGDKLYILHDVNDTGVNTSADVMSLVAQNEQGDAVITLGAQVIVLDEIDPQTLGPGVFVIF